MEILYRAELNPAHLNLVLSKDGYIQIRSGCCVKRLKYDRGVGMLCKKCGALVKPDDAFPANDYLDSFSAAEQFEITRRVGAWHGWGRHWFKVEGFHMEIHSD